MLCLSRVTDERYARRFGDGEHKFYFEIRCNQPCVEGKEICKKCERIYPACKNQFCRYFPHGKVTEPIPDRSHIYGGKWYQAHLAEWGEPSKEMIQFAKQHQDAAREGCTLSKEDKPSIQQDMPRKQKAVSIEETEKADMVSADIVTADAVTTKINAASVKRTRKLKIAEETKEVSVEIKPKKKAAPKKKKDAPPSPIVQPALVHKEVVIPFFKEGSMEELDTDDYDVEYVRLFVFELNHISYFRDPKKNKIYRREKNQVREYLGRFDPDTETIDSDVPDSDDEN